VAKVKPGNLRRLSAENLSILIANAHSLGIIYHILKENGQRRRNVWLAVQQPISGDSNYGV
jgi:hypothetical protein